MKLRTSDLHESIDLTEATLDHEKHIIKNATIIKSGWSLNNKYYADDMLAKHTHVWEGLRSYADHPSKDEQKNRPERSVRDILGIWENVRHESPATKGDFKLLGNEWLWPLIVETVEMGKPIVASSINALGQTSKGEIDGRKGLIVEAITHGNSVDIVTDAGAGGGFVGASLTASDDGWTRAVLDSVSIDELREARPDVIEALKDEWKTVRDSAALAEANERANRAEAQAKALEEEKRTIEAQLQDAQESIARTDKERRVDSLLEGAKLPGEWRNDLRAELLDADQSTWINILEAEKRKAKAIKPKTIVTGAGSPAGPTPAQLRVNSQPQTAAVRIALSENAPQPDEDYSTWKKRINR